MTPRTQQRILLALSILLGLGLVVYTSFLLIPWIYINWEYTPKAPEHRLVPDFDYSAWHALPVQDGRIKPLQTESLELVRQITGRSSFEQTDPVGLVLTWMLLEGKPGMVDWEHYPFILCDHHGLRSVIFAHLAEASSKELQGKYVTPAQLRSSPGFDELLAEVAKQRKQFQGKAHYQLSTTHLKAEEVARRLGLYDSICGKASTQLFKNAMMGEKYLDLQEFADLEEATPAEALLRLEQKRLTSTNPLRIVNLPNVPGNAWFSLTELRRLHQEPARWKAVLDSRLAESPQKYLRGEYIHALGEFEEALAQGKASPLLDELDQELGERRAQRIKAVRDAKNPEALDRALTQAVQTKHDQDAVRAVVEQAQKTQLDTTATRDLLITELTSLLTERDRQLLTRLSQGAERVAQRPDDPELQILPMMYLEARFTDLYRSTAPPIEAPTGEVRQILGDFDYAGFNRQSTRFQETLRRIGDPKQYAEAQRAFAWELYYNRTHPFRWAWITLLAALAVLLVHQQSGWRVAYVVGVLLFIMALLIQCFGFTLRIMVAGRAPVGNMYETVVFVAFLAAFFALVLELVYRRTVIAIAGAAVGALGLVLADQLPLALDPKISPLVPILRSNFWLTVHVVTIVASYAGATLAWGLGNVSLALLAFGKPNRELLRTLSLYTYRAIQIAVVLLALGTVLGAWWASEAWGRYWGWDPKEVGALIALVCYVIPLHARFAGWIKDFGLAVAAVLCYAAIILSWYVINFVIAAGLHSYGFSGGGGEWVLWAGLVNLEWVLIATLLYQRRLTAEAQAVVPAAA